MCEKKKEMLIKEEILKYCKYYHDEVISPYTDSDSTLIWMAERFLCEEGTHLIDEKDIKNSIYDIIYSYVGKWNPYEQDVIMGLYSKTPTWPKKHSAGENTVKNV